jgi:integrase
VRTVFTNMEWRKRLTKSQNESLVQAKPISIAKLIEKAKVFANESISKSTKKAYQSDWRTFEKFCSQHGFTSIPATNETVCLFVTDRSETARVDTIVRSVCAIGKIHEWRGYDNPTRGNNLRAIMEGIKRKKYQPKDKAKPINLSLLKKMIQKADPSIIGIRDKTLLLVGWFGALRRSEIANLKIGNLSITDQGAELTLLTPKGNQTGDECVTIPRIESILCPVASLENWLSRYDYGPEYPLFPSFGLRGKKLWIPKDETVHRPMCDRLVSEIVKKYVAFCGENPKRYSAHSLRRGLSSESARLNVPQVYLQRHLRHKSSAMTSEYIDRQNAWTENPVTALGHALSLEERRLEEH